MSKKDYQAIARAIFRVRTGQDSYSNPPVGGGPSGDVGDRITHAIADVLAAENPRFDRARFLEACRTGKCKGMRPVAA